jgi:hypothetical protein
MPQLLAEPERVAGFNAEMLGALERDTTALGEMWRGRRSGLTDEQIAERRGTENTNWIWLYERFLKALTTGDLPTAPSVARHSARNYRRLLQRGDFSAPVAAVLAEDLAVLEARAQDQSELAREDEKAQAVTAEAEQEAVPGIYVYALPHYLRHPYDDERGATLLKVGRTDRDSIVRFREQTRTTALPEDPVLLRIYSAEGMDTLDIENRFHRLMEKAGHARSAARTGGREWFVTSVGFLDEIARTLGLKIRAVSDLADLISAE